MNIRIRHSNTLQPGFTLPAVVIICTALMTIGLSLIQNSSSVYDSLNDQYYNRLAQEAAEAGVAYANFCLSDNSFQQSWGPAVGKPNLTQKTDCDGATIASAPDYLMQNGSVRTSFSVGNLDTRSDGAVIFAVTGTVQNVSSGGSVSRSYNTGRKEVVKWKEFNPTVSSSGTSKTCAVVTNELYCWGKNSNNPGGDNLSGNLGDGTTTDSLVPVKVRQDTGVLAGKVVSKVTSAQFHSCALAEGSVYCWGRNQFGQLGKGDKVDSTIPVKVGGALASLSVTDIGASGNSSCAIANNKIYCWGSNVNGSVGNNSSTDMVSPTAVSTTNLGGSYTATKLSTSGSRSENMCAIANGKAWCWGNNQAGQIGNNTSGSTIVRVPTKVLDTGVLSGKTVTAISQDGYATGNPSYTHVCVVADAKAYCWGDNDDGQLGRGNTTSSSAPIAVSTSGVLSGKTVTDIISGLRHSCALTSENKVYCWGNNSAGQVGDATNNSRTSPVAVYTGGGLSGQNVVAIGGGANRGCAITDGYQSFCWGLNTDGQLGDGTQTNRNEPTEAIFLRPKAPTYIF